MPELEVRTRVSKPADESRGGDETTLKKFKKIKNFLEMKVEDPYFLLLLEKK